MHNQSITPSPSIPRQPQSVAALLPEEIIDSILLQLGYDYSTPAWYTNQVGRWGVFSNMSVVAEGWTRSARRLLLRTVRIEEWSHLQEEVEKGMGEYVRELEICGGGWYGVMPQEVASAVFKLLKRLPNLRRLSLDALQFNSFDPADSTSMQTVVLLPHLHDLNISHMPSPSSLVVDLLATFGHRIDRLSVQFDTVQLASHAVCRQIDFRGKLRFLSTGPDFYRTLADPRRVAPEGLRELEELQSQGIDDESKEGGEEMYRVIGPTLSALAIDSDDVTWFAKFLPLFSNLSRLSIIGSYSRNDPDPTPLLRRLPPSLLSLRLDRDLNLSPTLARWTITPSLVPAGLKQIQIDDIENSETYQQLPSVPTLCTNYRLDTLDSLGRLSPGTLPFRTIEMSFYDFYSPQRSVVEAECLRLGVVFRQRIQQWDI